MTKGRLSLGRDSKASVFWRCFIHLFFFLFVVIVIPAYEISKLLDSPYCLKIGLVCVAVICIACSLISIYLAENYYDCSLIILLDDIKTVQSEIDFCLEKINYKKVGKSGNTVLFYSKSFRFARGTVKVEINDGCAVLHGPKNPVNCVAAVFDNCYNWSDKNQRKH